MGGMNWDLDAWNEITPRPLPSHLEILEKWIEEETAKLPHHEPGMSVSPDKALWSLCKLLLVTRRAFNNEPSGCHCLPEYAFCPMGCKCSRVRFAKLEPCAECCKCTRCDGQLGGTGMNAVVYQECSCKAFQVQKTTLKGHLACDVA